MPMEQSSVTHTSTHLPPPLPVHVLYKNMCLGYFKQGMVTKWHPNALPSSTGAQGLAFGLHPAVRANPVPGCKPGADVKAISRDCCRVPGAGAVPYTACSAGAAGQFLTYDAHPLLRFIPQRPSGCTSGHWASGPTSCMNTSSSPNHPARSRNHSAGA